MTEMDIVHAKLAEKSRPIIKKWCHPPESIVKVNFDATFKPYNRESFWGCIICNNQGLVMSSGVISNKNVMSTFFTLACL